MPKRSKDEFFIDETAKFVWSMKYKHKTDETVNDTWIRVAKGLAAPEKEEVREHWEQKFYELLKGFKFLPGGRILGNAGTGRTGTSLINCVVSDDIPDSIGGIFEKLKESTLTLQTGSGIGYSFSTLRPKGAYVKGVDSEASGPLSFMRVYDTSCKTIRSAGSRRGAQLATLRVDHPDIREFVTSKLPNAKIDKFKQICRDAGLEGELVDEVLGPSDGSKFGLIENAKDLTQFNISVGITDEFMEAVKKNKKFDLRFDGKVYETVDAKQMFDEITKLTYECNDPGVLFLDTINRLNNLWYCERIETTNPCGEQVLPPYGSCLLGSMNLTQYIDNPFEDDAKFDFDRFREDIAVAVRMMDNVIEVTYMSLPEQIEEMKSKRRIGLGITGLGDALTMMKLVYGSTKSVVFTDLIMHCLADSAYRASIELGKEKGSFPLFDAEKYTQSKYLKNILPELIDEIREYGIRNSHLLSVQPTGTISQVANQVSSGLEPIFIKEYKRRILMDDSVTRKEIMVCDYAWRLYKDKFGEDAKAPEYFVDTSQLTVDDHINIQIAVATYLDAACSKTINIPANYSFEDFQKVYMRAWESGVIKGVTTYREGTTISVLSKMEDKKETKKKTDKRFKRKPKNPAKAYKIKTPEGSIYPFIVEQDDQPIELFLNSGKHTQHIDEWLKALGRMISLYLQDTKIEDKKEALKIVANNLRGINSENVTWVGKHVVKSVPDAIGYVIYDFLGDIDLFNKELPDMSHNKKEEKNYKCPKCKQYIPYKPGCENPPCPECGYEGRCGG